MLDKTIAHYKVLSKLGEGGMGAVYRATDTKLQRDVAIKVLPDSFAQDEERLARFVREAQVLASLNHPNIAAVYGIEERAIVMELVEGPTLADRIAQSPLPVAEAVEIARQIAEALEAAHEEGIIHRDLKPANVKITPEGKVKVLDFGLAKLSEAGETDQASVATVVRGNSPTMAGVIMGTAGYMAPEQAAGKLVDKRADIWSFGVVLWEMLAGRPLFDGETVSHTLADVLRRDIRLDDLPRGTPASLQTLLRRCLERNVRNRLRDIGEARFLLESGLQQTSDPAPVATAAKPGKVLWLSAVASVLALAFVVVSVLYWKSTRPQGPRPMLRLSVDIGEDVELPDGAGGTLFALSPDGTRMALVVKTAAGVQLAVRHLGQDGLTLLPGTEGAESPFFSPDGEWIGFAVDRVLKKVAVAGGVPVTLADIGFLRGASWGDTGTIIASNNRGPLLRINASGGAPEQITKLDANERTHRFPHWVPEHQLLLFTCAGASTNYDEANICAQSLKTGKRVTVWKGGHSPHYASGGYLLYHRLNTLYGVRFDAGSLELRGSPVPLLENVGTALDGRGLASWDSAATLVVSTAARRQSRQMTIVWVDANGKEQPLLETLGRYYHPALSPDGQRLAYVSRSAGGTDIWIKDLARGAIARLTFTPGINVNPVWSPDGKWILYRNTAGAGVSRLFAIPFDGSRPPTQILDVDTAWVNSFSPDGKRVALHKSDVRTGWDIFTAQWSADAAQPSLGKPELLLATAASEFAPSISPDRRWLAYSASNETGRTDVFVRPFSETGGVWQVSTGGGRDPRWSSHQELIFQSNEGIMAVPYSVSGNAFVPGKPRLWTKIRPTNPGFYEWNVSPDGTRLVVCRPVNGQESARPFQLRYLANFADEMRQKVK